MRALGAAVAVLLAGCFEPVPAFAPGRDASPDAPDAGAADCGAPAPGPDAGGDFFSSRGAYASAACDRLAACGLSDPSARADCVGFLEKRSPFHRPSTEESVKEGLNAFDSAAWQACLADLASLPCEAIRDAESLAISMVSTCAIDAVLPASVPVGGRCIATSNCSGASAECEKSGACEGTCASTLRGLGEACDEAHDCDPLLGACGYLPDSGWTCVAWLTTGAPCSNAQGALAGCAPGDRCDDSTLTCVALQGLGDSCSSASDCHWTLRCDAATSRCAEKLREGGACRGSGDCADGFDCAPESQACEERLREVGQSCRPGQGCSGSRCVGGTCAPRAGAGEPCDPASVLSDCAAGLACDPAAAKCRRLGAIGDPCDRTAQQPQCLVFLACRDGACAALPGLDEPCASGSHPSCAAPLFCDGSACRAPQPDGWECWSSDECESGHCQRPGDDGLAATCRKACF